MTVLLQMLLLKSHAFTQSYSLLKRAPKPDVALFIDFQLN